ncbi:hypothetical protein PO124_24215 [Bacillus licheniformis]|nr:hypothetical protein [Bacillus licheniformis]
MASLSQESESANAPRFEEVDELARYRRETRRPYAAANGLGKWSLQEAGAYMLRNKKQPAQLPAALGPYAMHAPSFKALT